MTGNGKDRLFSFGSFLFMISLAYGGAVKLREILCKKSILRSKKLPCFVISIGNLTVGGTGKTPMTIHVAKLLKSLGYKVAVISRGYRGSAEKTGGVVSDGRKIFMGPDAAGDEPYMMAVKLKSIPVIVGQDRFKAGIAAIKKFNPDVILLDDAFQHIKLVRDIDLALLDYRHPFGNTYLLPRGILREPISALKRADAFILTRSDARSDEDFSVSGSSEEILRARLKHFKCNAPIFKTFHIANIFTVIKEKKSTSEYSSEFLQGRRVFAFSGLADNRDFRRTIAGFKCVMTGFLEFPDHHPYSDKDFENIVQSAKSIGADCLITTEKDYVRIAHRATWPIDIVVIGLEISFENDDSFNTFIKTKLEGIKRSNVSSGTKYCKRSQALHMHVFRATNIAHIS